MKPPSGITIDTAPEAPPQNDETRKPGKPNIRCTCGNLIVHVKHDDEGRPLSPRHHTVFNRLYRHRLTKELHRRKLAAEQIEKEARDCTWIPITNSVRQEVRSTSSLSGIAHRERTIEMARERFNQGIMCVECLKKVEISTGTYILDDEHLGMRTTQSLPNHPSPRELRTGPNDLPPDQIEFTIAPKAENKGKAENPRPPAGRQVQEKESRNDDLDESNIQQRAPVEREVLPVTTDHEDHAGFADSMHPPREILVPSPVAAEKKEMTNHNLNRFGFPGPSPTRRSKKVAESRCEQTASQKQSLPPRAPTPTKAFSFDAVSPISSEDAEHPKVETIGSHATPILKNNIVEETMIQLDSPSSQGSTVSSGIPLRLDSYMSLDVVPETPRSVPFDEKPDSEPTSPGKAEGKPATEEKEATSPPVSPASKESESMRKVSILDREDSFNGPMFVIVVQPEEGGNKDCAELEKSDWIEQMTGSACVACDDAASKRSATSITNDEEAAEQQAADRAYVGCEVDTGEMECIDLRDETEVDESNLPEPEQPETSEPYDDKVDFPFDEEEKDITDKAGDQGNTSEAQREAWLAQATEWAAYAKSASPISTEEPATDSESNAKTVNINEKANEEGSKGSNPGEVTLAPTDEQGFFGRENSKSSAGEKSSESEPFFGGSQKSGDKSTACSTVALTEDSNTDGHSRELNERVRTSEGDFDNYLDRFTDCVTCWQLEPWPVLHQK